MKHACLRCLRELDLVGLKFEDNERDSSKRMKVLWENCDEGGEEYDVVC